ncbi:glycosyltransferase family A protein [Nostoc sp. TCL26-01]|uniref:glycosyltransferase family 2 protein n=1 Tax=Nostoc sp. TCL26-01 TaxID=2576904 RepID=UPI0015BEAD8C|nr:glycosyltransferase family A protein [Nostoc sp. TCL26-01]QLE59614.1 glycosyltransferase family 2 protein [Nostoc sp. TCL26-01]QLE59643.1 glycosyltransferase family 2 protein [Nostoc sp. TCL26-01]
MTISVITATYNRPQQLYTVAFNSLLNQTDHNFEWVVINDGCNQQTREMIATLQAPFPIAYVEIEHSSTGFGLCYARNAGLNLATGSLITYLDDDNSFEREFICATKHFFQQHGFVKYSMAIQKRRRDVVLQHKTIRSSKIFTSPSNSFCTLDNLISQQEIFDSNGFTHVHNSTPKWNPKYQIFADYEFLLQCTKEYGNSTFKLHPQVLVNYIQSSGGTIGRSHYGQWAAELKQILQDSSVYLLQPSHIAQLGQLAQAYHCKALERPPAFV